MATLYVDLRTDFARTEIRIIEIHLIENLARKRRQEIYVEFMAPPAGDLLAGIRVTEVNDLTSGTYFLVIRLLDRRGASIGMATALITIRADIVVRMVIAH